MMKRLQTEVLDMKPDLVIWQVGTNAVLRNLDPVETIKLVEEGSRRIQATGADLVLVDPQYSPVVNARAESASKMINLLGKVAELRHVGIFPRFEVMRDWHEKQAIPIDNFVIADGLHMSDWGYACSRSCSAMTSSSRSARSSSASTCPGPPADVRGSAPTSSRRTQGPIRRGPEEDQTFLFVGTGGYGSLRSQGR